MRTVKLTIVVASLLAALSCAPGTGELLDVDYSDWTQLNPRPITMTIPGHGSGIRNIYMNPQGERVTVTVEDGRRRWNYPEGTVILKTVAGMADSGRITMMLGMVKLPDHPGSQGGWVWVSRNPENGEENLFTMEYCVSCHTDANEVRRTGDAVPIGVPNPQRDFRDFVFYPYYPAE